ncbi:hypothetical protein GCM10027568_15290 [Humibacter soli]
MARRPRPIGGDAAAIAHASRVVTARITIAAAAIVVLVVAATAAFILDQSRPSELLEKPQPGQTKIYVDADDLLIAMIGVGAIAIVLAGFLSWVIARGAVEPLGEALRIQRTFVADASHELRTPVAVVAARVEVLKQEIDAGDDPGDNLRELQHDVRLLGDVITDLLLAAAPPAEREQEGPVHVAEVVDDTLTDLRILAEPRGVVLDATVDGDIATTMPRTSLRRCVVVLVDNAIGHSPDGGTVGVRVASTRDRQWFTLAVEDHGSGISGVDPGRLFERFAHGDDAVTGPVRTGYGIGLSLVRDLADRYGGRIEVTDTSSAGTTFTLHLPRA